MTDAKLAELEVMAEEDMYTKMKKLEGLLEFLELQEEYIKDEQKNLKRELIRAQVGLNELARSIWAKRRRLGCVSVSMSGLVGLGVDAALALASPFCSLRWPIATSSTLLEPRFGVQITSRDRIELITREGTGSGDLSDLKPRRDWSRVDAFFDAFGSRSVLQRTLLFTRISFITWRTPRIWLRDASKDSTDTRTLLTLSRPLNSTGRSQTHPIRPFGDRPIPRTHRPTHRNRRLHHRLKLPRPHPLHNRPRAPQTLLQRRHAPALQRARRRPPARSRFFYRDAGGRGEAGCDVSGYRGLGYSEAGD